MLYKLNKNTNRNNYSKVKRVTLSDIGWKEKDLENLISNNIQDFISSNDLMAIFTERARFLLDLPTKFTVGSNVVILLLSNLFPESI